MPEGSYLYMQYDIPQNPILIIKAPMSGILSGMMEGMLLRIQEPRLVNQAKLNLNPRPQTPKP